MKTLLKKLFLIFLFCAHIEKTTAQPDSIWKKAPEVHIGGFVDVFYAYDFNKPETSYRQTFLYNHNRHNEFNLNLGLIKLSATHQKYRVNFALHAGTYVNDNYASEPGVLKHIYEASAGISLNRKNNLWLDGGIFSSHIGFESALSIDNWTLTRSLLAENSPYYLTGAKLTFSPNQKWEAAILICNGWQRIQKVQGNSLPSFGTQLKFLPNEKVILNWSTFIGTDNPDTTRRMRYFSNLYGQIQFSKNFGLIAGFDIGTQQKAKSSLQYDLWFSPVIIVRYSFFKKWAMALRGEYYQDENAVIIDSGTANGFKTTGLSLNIDYSPISNISCRVEGRWLNSRDNIFEIKNAKTNNNIFIVASIAARLTQTFNRK